jgi:hypothetical protein
VRKILAIALTVILFANVFGYFISFSVQRYKIKAEVKQLLKKQRMKQTQVFAFTKEEYQSLKKFENGKEFLLNGGMYDVVKKELHGGKVILTAYYDHAETGLIDKLVSYFNEDTTSKGNHTLPLFSLLEFVFYPTEWMCYNHTVLITVVPDSCGLLALSLDSDSPPPDGFSPAF